MDKKYIGETDLKEIIKHIKSKFIMDYDGSLIIYFQGERHMDYKYSIDEDIIIFNECICYPLLQWLEGILKTDHEKWWTIEWCNK